MANKIDPNELIYKLDDWADGDPKTNDFNPGFYKKQKLKLIAVQTERRLLFFGRTKNWIYQIGNEPFIVYKPYPKAAGVVIMGLSMKSMHWHPKSVPMEFYVKAFLHPSEVITKEFVKKFLQPHAAEGWIPITGAEWLKLNDFKLV